jgi:outer membrane protein X
MVGLFVLALAGGASAQEKHLSFGVQANWGSDTDIGIGALARLDLEDVHEGLGVVGSFNYFFPGTEGADDIEGMDVDVKYWELNLNGTYDIQMEGSMTPYVGVGPVLAHASGGASAEVAGVEISGSTSESKLGLNILGGIKFDVSESMKAFVEAKYEVLSEGGSQLVISGGVRF